MQKFIVVAFHEKKQKLKELVDWLDEMQEQGNYSAADMSQFYFNVCPSGLILIDYANMDLGRSIKDKGFTVRQQIWRDL